MRPVTNPAVALPRGWPGGYAFLGYAIGVAVLELIRPYLGLLLSLFKSRAALQAENLALRHQLCVHQRNVKRPKVLSRSDALDESSPMDHRVAHGPLVGSAVSRIHLKGDEW